MLYIVGKLDSRENFGHRWHGHYTSKFLDIGGNVWAPQDFGN
jgi:hypothetical protein